MSGTQTGAVPVKQLVPNNVQSTVEQQALVSVYIKMGAVASHDPPSGAVCAFSQEGTRYLPCACLLCCQWSPIKQGPGQRGAEEHVAVSSDWNQCCSCALSWCPCSVWLERDSTHQHVLQSRVYWSVSSVSSWSYHRSSRCKRTVHQCDSVKGTDWYLERVYSFL